MSEPVSTNPTITETAPETQPAQTGAAVTFASQEEFNRVIAERIKRAEKAVETKLLADFGVETFDNVKTVLQKDKEAELAKQGEVKQWQTKHDALEKKLAAALAENEGYKANEVKGKRMSAIKDALRDAKATKVDDLLIILEGKYAADVNAVLDEDGAVNKKVVEKLVASAKASNDEFFPVSIPGSQSNRNGRPKQPDNKVVLTRKLSY